MKKIFLFFMVIAMAAFLSLTCDALGGGSDDDDGGGGSTSITGVWEMDSMTMRNASGELITGDGPNPMEFPMDWIAVMHDEMGGTGEVDYDLDEDGQNELVTFSLFVSITTTTADMYAAMVVTDPGDSLEDYIIANFGPTDEMGLPFFETGIRYNSTQQSQITITDTTITGLMDENEDVNYVLSGSTLTITATDDRGTTDTADDEEMTIVFSQASSSDIEGAVDDTTLEIFGGDEEA